MNGYISGTTLLYGVSVPGNELYMYVDYCLIVNESSVLILTA